MIPLISDFMDDAGHPCDAGHPMLRYQDFQGLKLVAKDVLKVLY